MFKTVDVIPQFPIYALRVPIVGPVLNTELSIGDIRTCLHSGAFVDEILESGDKVRLNLSNYDKDNSLKATAKREEEAKKEAEKVPTPSVGTVESPEENKEPEKVKEPENKVKTEEVDPSITPVDPEKVEKPVESVKGEVKTSDRDPKYFKENEKNKNKIQA